MYNGYTIVHTKIHTRFNNGSNSRSDEEIKMKLYSYTF